MGDFVGGHHRKANLLSPKERDRLNQLKEASGESVYLLVPFTRKTYIVKTEKNCPFDPYE